MSTRPAHALLAFAAGAGLALALRIAVSTLDDAALYTTATASALALAVCAWLLARRRGRPAPDAAPSGLALASALAAFGAGTAGVPLLLDAITPPWPPPSSASQAEALSATALPDAALIGLANAWDGAGNAAAFALAARDQDTRDFGVLLRDARFAAPLARVSDDPSAALCEQGLLSVAFARAHERVWLAGFGGGIELGCARRHAARTVDVSEPSAALRAVAARAPLDSERGGDGTQVHWHAEHPRMFARAHARRYDLVLLPAQDEPAHTWPAGLLPLREATLETDAGLEAVLDTLADGGALFAILNGEPAALRFAATARAVLLRRGVAHPERHIVVHQSGDSYGVTVKRAPFVLDEVLDLHQRNRAHKAPDEQPWFDALVRGLEQAPALRFTPGSAFQNRFGRLLAPSPRGAIALTQEYVFDLSPPPDARPLFYETSRTDLVEGLSAHAAARALPLLALLACAFVLVLGAAAGASLAPGPGGRLAALLPPIATACAQALAFAWAQHALTLWLIPSQAFACAALATSIGAAAAAHASAASMFARGRALLLARAIALLAFAVIGFALESLLGRAAARGNALLVLTACAVLFALGAGLVLPSAIALVRPRAGAPSPAWLAFAHAAGFALALPLAATLVLFASYQALLIAVAGLLALLLPAALFRSA